MDGNHGWDAKRGREEGEFLLCLHSHHDDDDGAYGGAHDGYELMANGICQGDGTFYLGAAVEDVPNVDNPD